MALQRPEDQRFRVWSMDQMWFGGPETGKQVWPSVGDLVVESDVGLWTVIEVGPTGIPKLEMFMRATIDPSLDRSNDSIITALSEYQPSLATPAFYDTSKNPQEVTIDTAYPILDQEADKMIFYLGTDVDPATAIPVSQTFSGATVVNNDVALEPISPGNPIRRPKVFTTRVPLQHQQLITGVVYKADGSSIGKRSFVIQESGTIRPGNASVVAVSQVTLKSDLIDPIDRNLINNDLNMPFVSTLTEAILHYTDGSTKEIPIDGNKCVLRGLQDVNWTQAVKPYNFSLMYFPDPDEPYVNAVGETTSRLVTPYRLKNTYKTNDFSLKLFIIPVFQNVADGYKLTFRLADVERDLDVDVTDKVIVRKIGGVTFEPANYGAEQTLDCVIDMDEVAPGQYPDFVFTERVVVTVNLPGILDKDPWVIDYNTDGNNKFGLNMAASIGPGVGEPVRGNIRIHFGNGRGSEANWLHQLYHTIEPLFDTSALLEPVTPTHFKYRYEGLESEVYEVSQWNDELPKLANIEAFEEDKTVTIVWLFEEGGGYGILGHSPLMTVADLV